LKPVCEVSPSSKHLRSWPGKRDGDSRELQGKRWFGRDLPGFLIVSVDRNKNKERQKREEKEGREVCFGTRNLDKAE